MSYDDEGNDGEWVDPYDAAEEQHWDEKISEHKERRAGLHDADFGSDAWCERRGRCRLRGRSGDSYPEPRDVAESLRWVGANVLVDGGSALAIDYIPRAYRLWFGKGI